MKMFKIFLLITFSLVSICSIKAQDGGAYNYEDEQEDTSRFFIGINFGGYFPNNNTAGIYSGTSNATQYGIHYVMNQREYEQTFKNYFNQHLYSIEEYPSDPKYKTAFEIGLHAGYRLNKRISFFLDFNTIQLRYEQAFTVAIEDPGNQMVGPTYEAIPIFGKENRISVNLGMEYNFYTNGKSTAYLPLFANATDVELKSNYFVVNNQQYELFHYNYNLPSQRIGGIGYGGGTGLGFKFHLNDQILADLYYNLIYTEINLKTGFQEYGVQNGLGVRILWVK
jgi:hypothetical protein